MKEELPEEQKQILNYLGSLSREEGKRFLDDIVMMFAPDDVRDSLAKSEAKRKDFIQFPSEEAGVISHVVNGEREENNLRRF